MKLRRGGSNDALSGVRTVARVSGGLALLGLGVLGFAATGHRDANAAEFLVGTRPVTVEVRVHNSAHATVASVDAGTAVHPRVTVFQAIKTDPNPTGEATISYYTNGACTSPLDPVTVQLPNSTLDAVSYLKTPMVPGTYAFRAQYSGSDLFAADASPCTTFTVTKATAVLTLVMHDPGHNAVSVVPLGTNVHVLGTVSGAAATPQGAIHYRAYSTSDCSGTADQGVARPGSARAFTHREQRRRRGLESRQIDRTRPNHREPMA